MNYEEKKDKVKKYLKEIGFKYAGDGKSRKVYYRNSIVVKIPKFSEAQLENSCEWKAYKKSKDRGDEYASCRLFSLFSINLLMMERVEVLDKEIDKSWVKKLDENQVGVDSDGNLKAFDYPDDPLYSEEQLNKRTHDKIVELALT